jgi:hypothetical protein
MVDVETDWKSAELEQSEKVLLLHVLYLFRAQNEYASYAALTGGDGDAVQKFGPWSDQDCALRILF